MLVAKEPLIEIVRLWADSYTSQPVQSIRKTKHGSERRLPLVYNRRILIYIRDYCLF